MQGFVFGWYRRPHGRLPPSRLAGGDDVLWKMRGMTHPKKGSVPSCRQSMARDLPQTGGLHQEAG